MRRYNEIWSASLKYADENPSDYINEMYDIVDIEKAFKAGARWADANPANYEGKAMLHILEKGVKQGRKEVINKACEWLKKNRKNYSSNALGEEYLIDDFKKAMKK